MQNQMQITQIGLHVFWILTLCTELNAKDVLIINYTVRPLYKYCILRCYWHLVLNTNELYLSHAIGNVRMYLRIGPKTRTNRRFSKSRPDAWTKAKKEDVAGETRTYGNRKWSRTHWPYLHVRINCSPPSSHILSFFGQNSSRRTIQHHYVVTFPRAPLEMFPLHLAYLNSLPGINND